MRIIFLFNPITNFRENYIPFNELALFKFMTRYMGPLLRIFIRKRLFNIFFFTVTKLKTCSVVIMKINVLLQN